ncbi:DUF4160 domain-containing protein [Stenotrophomonas rhizophila]
MDEVPLFLSGPAHHEGVSLRSAEDGAMELLRAIKRVSSLGRPIIVGSAVRLFDMTFTNTYVTIAKFDSVDLEWCRFIKQIDQKSPFSEVPQCVPPIDTAHSVGGDAEEACFWAISNAAFTLSLPILAGAQEAKIVMDICACVDGQHAPASVVCRNISNVSHVDVWKEQILDFGYKESSSSTVFEEVDFLLKMYLHDHEPPHIHVYQPGNDRLCVAKIRFDKVEVMESKGLDSRVKKAVIDLLVKQQDAFMRAWKRCRDGQLPNRIAV